jgi:hypothetical protein
MNVHKIRTDAQRFVRVLVAAGANSAEPMANAWIQQMAAHASFNKEELVAAVQYAWEQGWIDNGPSDGWTLLTVAGQRAGST